MAIREKQIEFRPDVEPKLPVASVIIAALLHDVCKADIYEEGQKFRKGANGRWEPYSAYDIDDSALPVGHGEKSVIRLLQWGLEMTNDEILAIRWHMDAWDLAFNSIEAKSNINAAKDQCPLLSVIKAADGLASFVLETR